MRVVQKTANITNWPKEGPTLLRAMTEATTNEAPSSRPEQIGITWGQTKIVVKCETIQLHMTEGTEQSWIVEEGDTMIEVGARHDSTTAHHDSRWLPPFYPLPQRANQTKHYTFSISHASSNACYLQENIRNIPSEIGTMTHDISNWNDTHLKYP